MDYQIPPSEYVEYVSEDQRVVLDRMQEFSDALFQRILEADKGKSVAFSPLSLFYLLSYAVLGGMEDSYSIYQYFQALGLNNFSPERYHEAIREISLRYKSEKSPLSIANAVIAPTTTTIKKDFIEHSQKYYDAEVFQFDRNLLAFINKWVADHTDGLIPIFMTQLPPGHLLTAINAIVFHGKWESPFSPLLNYQKDFYLANGSKKKVTMMSRRGGFSLYRGNEYTFVKMPFGEEGFSYCVCMPNDPNCLGELAKELTFSQMLEVSSLAVGSHLDLSLPKQDIEFSHQFFEDLNAQGFPIKVPFTNIAEGPCYLHNIFQKVKILVHEDGVDGAAVSGANFCTSYVPRITIDRPFLYWVIDEEHQTPLFQGAVRDFSVFTSN